jgi:hydroxyacylglutathione hydrolase
VQIAPDKSLPRFVNSLIILGDSITIIDCGVKNSYKLIYDYIEKNNRKISDIKTLILSHSHPDHIGSAQKIKTDTGCNVIAHFFEKDWIENIDLQYKLRPVPGFYNLVDKSVKVDTLLVGVDDLKLDKDINISTIRAFKRIVQHFI